MIRIETEHFTKISQNVTEDVVADYNAAVKSLQDAWIKHKKAPANKAPSTMESLKPGNILITRWHCLKDKAIEKGHPEMVRYITQYFKAFQEEGDKVAAAGKKNPYGQDNPIRNLNDYQGGQELQKLIQSIGLTPSADAAGEVK